MYTVYDDRGVVIEKIDYDFSKIKNKIEILGKFNKNVYILANDYYFDSYKYISKLKIILHLDMFGYNLLDYHLNKLSDYKK